MAQRKRKTSATKSQRSKQKKGGSSAREIDRQVKDDIWAILIIAFGVFLVLAFQFRIAGAVGTGLFQVFTGLFGAAAYIFPYYIGLYGLLLLTRKAAGISGRTVLLLAIMFFMVVFINGARFLHTDQLYFDWTAVTVYYKTGIALGSGGFFGMYLGGLLAKAIGVAGLYIFSFVLLLICLLLVVNTPISRFFEEWREHRNRKKLVAEEREESQEAPSKGKKAVKGKGEQLPLQEGVSNGQRNILDYVKDDNLFHQQEEEKTSFGLSDRPSPSAPGYGVDPPMGLEEIPPSEPVDEILPGKRGKIRGDEGNQGAIDIVGEKEKEKPQATLPPEEWNTTVVTGDYQFPSLELLNKGKATRSRAETNNSLNAKAAKLEETLRNFNIDAKILQVIQGPAVTRFEIQPNVGVKVKSITNLADDIALNLAARSIRMEAPIPGKAAVGIEIENDRVNMITLREIIGSKEFCDSKSKITFAVGKDIAGKPIVADLKAMPHMLIAGATGSGKSVCINSIITSLLYKATPEEVKLVLIDPKVVELANYNGIPHLLIPVVTEPGKAAAALNWAVAEMDERYKKFAQEGVRELQSYNRQVRKSKEEDKEVLPQIVIIIDELADLMMAAPAQVEESICRLAQKARAAGMHLIVATQRPSVDVITGVIKANIPSRIAFAVSSQFDSRTILDMAGAEKLVGKGDMLFSPIGDNKPTRVQGTFVSDGEVNSVIDFVKGQVEEAEYSDEVLTSIENAPAPGEKPEGDELLPEAIELVVTSGKAAISMLQRRLGVGYNRAADLMDMMQAKNVVGPNEGTKPRKVLMTEEEFYAMKNQLEETKEAT